MSAGDNWERGEPKSNTGKILLIIGLVGCGGVLLLVAACAGLGWWGYSKMTKEAPVAQAAAESFLDDIKANRVDAAYGHLSREYQKTMNKQAFESYLKAFPVLASYTSRQVVVALAFPVQNSGGGSVTFRLTSPKATNTCAITLVKEEGQWKVQQLQVQ